MGLIIFFHERHEKHENFVFFVYFVEEKNEAYLREDAAVQSATGTRTGSHPAP